MDDREFEKIYEVLRDMNRNIEQGMDKINDRLEKIADNISEIKE